MTHNNNSVQRTAPIPIAPKPLAPRPDSAAHRQPESFRRFEIGPSSLHARDSVSASAPTPSNGQSLPPCRACRYAGTRCIPSEDDEGCISCQVNAADCSLSSSPQSRKRKLNGDTPEISDKKRSVTLLFPYPTATPWPMHTLSSLPHLHSSLHAKGSRPSLPAYVWHLGLRG